MTTITNSEPKLLPAPKQHIVHGVNGITGIHYHVRPLATWFISETERAVPYVASTDCPIEAVTTCNRLNAAKVVSYRPKAHPPQLPTTTASAHIGMARERYLSKHPFGLW